MKRAEGVSCRSARTNAVWSGIVWKSRTSSRRPGLQARTWVHIGATYDGVHQRLYVDGLRVDTHPGTLQKHDAELLYIGRCGAMDWNFTFTGVLDDVRVYNRALSGQEIGRLYQEVPSSSD
ncbi:MAG: LamG domain-containing protein [Candidatus Latescibacteria bacterium]|nr:LamG domain-containing protein [Candidatus Latescibacterota bacterium]